MLSIKLRHEWFLKFLDWPFLHFFSRQTGRNQPNHYKETLLNPWWHSQLAGIAISPPSRPPTETHTPVETQTHHRYDAFVMLVFKCGWWHFNNSFRLCHFNTFSLVLLFDLSVCLQAPVQIHIHCEHWPSLLHWCTERVSQMLYYEELMTYNELKNLSEYWDRSKKLNKQKLWLI